MPRKGKKGDEERKERKEKERREKERKEKSKKGKDKAPETKTGSSGNGSPQSASKSSKRDREALREEIRAILNENESKRRRTQVEEAEDSEGDSDSSEQLPSNILSTMLATLQGTGDGKGEHVSRMRPFQSYSSPLGAALPAAIKKKIRNGEYVHLETLLPSYKNELSICLADANSTEGKVSFTPSKNATIKSFDQWEEAILIFGSILLGAHPEECEGMVIVGWRETGEWS